MWLEEKWRTTVFYCLQELEGAAQALLKGALIDDTGHGDIHGAGADGHADNALIGCIGGLSAHGHIADGGIDVFFLQLAVGHHIVQRAAVHALTHMVNDDLIRIQQQSILALGVGAHGENDLAGLDPLVLDVLVLGLGEAQHQTKWHSSQIIPMQAYSALP